MSTHEVQEQPRQAGAGAAKLLLSNLLLSTTKSYKYPLKKDKSITITQLICNHLDDHMAMYTMMEAQEAGLIDKECCDTTLNEIYSTSVVMTEKLYIDVFNMIKRLEISLMPFVAAILVLNKYRKLEKKSPESTMAQLIKLWALQEKEMRDKYPCEFTEIEHLFKPINPRAYEDLFILAELQYSVGRYMQSARALWFYISVVNEVINEGSQLRLRYSALWGVLSSVMLYFYWKNFPGYKNTNPKYKFIDQTAHEMYSECKSSPPIVKFLSYANFGHIPETNEFQCEGKSYTDNTKKHVSGINMIKSCIKIFERYSGGYFCQSWYLSNTQNANTILADAQKLEGIAGATDLSPEDREFCDSLPATAYVKHCTTLFHWLCWYLFRKCYTQELTAKLPNGQLLVIQNEKKTVSEILVNLLSANNSVIISHIAPYLLRYYVVIAVMNRRRDDFFNTVYNAIKYTKAKYSDTFTKFFSSMSLDFVSSDAQVGEIENACLADPLLCHITPMVVEKFRNFVFETHCRVHRYIELDIMAKKLNLDPIEAEKWIISVLKPLKLTAKIDSSKGNIEILAAQVDIVEQFVTQISDIQIRTKALVKEFS